MAGNGYIKLFRKMVDWGWYKDNNTKAVFLHLLLTANYKETEYMGVKIYPGQTVIGRRSLASTLGMSEKKVRTALNHLKRTGEVAIKTTNRFSVVTITNWESYQFCDNEGAHETASETANKGPAKGHTIRKEEVKKREGGRAPRTRKNDLEETYAMMEAWANDEN